MSQFQEEKGYVSLDLFFWICFSGSVYQVCYDRIKEGLVFNHRQPEETHLSSGCFPAPISHLFLFMRLPAICLSLRNICPFSRFLPAYWYVKANNMLSGAEAYEGGELAQCLIIEAGFAVTLLLAALVVHRVKYSSASIKLASHKLETEH